VQCVIARPLARIALESRCLPFSLADEMRGLLVRSSRTAARDPARGESADFVIARIGSRAAVLRRSESTRMSSASNDKVGGLPARSAASGSEQSNRGRTPLLAPYTLLAPLAEAGAQ
jgi:hypothetical protein